MAVLVTGGAGYIGSHMVLELLERGERPVVLDDLSTGFEWAVPPQADLFIGDCGDQNLLDKIMRTRTISAVIHFAAWTVLPDSVSEPMAYYNNNTVKSRALIEACIRHRVPHFVFSSTAAVYGTPGARPVKEEEAVNPPSPYGRSKFMVEWMLEDAARASGLGYMALRYFNVAGADPQGRAGQSTRRATNLVKVVAEAAVGARRAVEIYGEDYPTPDGTGVRDYIHVSDLVSAHARALEYLRSDGSSTVLNVGYGTGYSVREVIKAAETVTGQPIPVVSCQRRPGDLSQVIADNSKLRALLNWTPQYNDINTIVRTAIDWQRRLNPPGIRLRAAG